MNEPFYIEGRKGSGMDLFATVFLYRHLNLQKGKKSLHMGFEPMKPYLHFDSETFHSLTPNAP